MNDLIQEIRLVLQQTVEQPRHLLNGEAEQVADEATDEMVNLLIEYDLLPQGTAGL